MKPLDPRLLHHARATRGFLASAVVIGAASALLIVAQALLIADTVASAFQRGANLEDVSRNLAALIAISAARAGLAWTASAVGHRSAAAAISELRLKVVDHALRRGGRPGPAGADSAPSGADTAPSGAGTARLGAGTARLGAGAAPSGAPTGPTGTGSAPVEAGSGTTGAGTAQGPGELTALVTTGADSLDAYFSRYLPQLVLAVLVPLIAGTAILTSDPLSALIVALTVPVIPVFMVLIGRYTEARVDRQWNTLGVLSGHFLDVVVGLPTLKVFNRAKAQAETIRSVGTSHRQATMGVLRVSFLSSLVLELLATLSVAVIAVAIGLRLVSGTMDLETGLAVLILAPEVYLPLRLVGMHFHAAADGVAAAERMFRVIEEGEPASTRPDWGSRGLRQVDAAIAGFRVRDLHVAYGERVAVAGASLDIRPGRVTALVGASGSGKSTILRTLLGLVGPAAQVSGLLEVESAGGERIPLDALDLAWWRAQVGWVPQSPSMLPGTVGENVRFGRGGFGDVEVVAALRAAGLDPAELPLGISTRVAEGGAGVSVGQARRIGVARALLGDPAILLLDEPTAALDDSREAEVGATVAALAARGRTVVVVTHRRSLIEQADEVVTLLAVPA